jgi:hypothetical protein
MIELSAQTLYETAQQVNGPISETQYAEFYKCYTRKIGKDMKKYSDKGKYQLIIGIANYYIPLSRFDELQLDESYSTTKFSPNNVLTFVEDLTKDLGNLGYDVKPGFVGHYGNDVMRVLTISWDMRDNKDVVDDVPPNKPSLIKRILTNYGKNHAHKN